jgi:hypothetical protein
LEPSYNYLVNGDFVVASRGTAFTSATTPANNDSTVLLDNWRLLSNGNDIVDVNRLAASNGARKWIELDIENAGKAGICQIIESREAVGMAGTTVSLSFDCKITQGSSINSIRAAVLEWTGAADSPTADVVSVWSAEGTNPTLVASWAASNTAVDLSPAPTSAVTRYRIEGISVASGATNVAVFLWIDDAAATVTDRVAFSNIMLEQRALSTRFIQQPVTVEAARAARFYQQYDYDETNGQMIMPIHGTGTDYEVEGSFHFPEMRSAPTVTFAAAAGRLAFFGNTVGGVLVSQALTVSATSHVNTSSLYFSGTTAGVYADKIAGGSLTRDSTDVCTITLTAEYV